jgi:hypothetical protein
MEMPMYLSVYNTYEILLCSLEYFFVVENITSSVQMGYQFFLILTSNFDMF